MTTLCERSSVSSIRDCLPSADTNRNEPPKAGELFGEAALTLAIPLVLALAISFVLPLTGLAGQ